MPRSSLSEQRIRYLQLVAGLTKHRDTLAHASIHDVDALKATLQAQVAAIEDAATKLAAYRTSVLRLREGAKQAHDAAITVRRLALVVLGNKAVEALGAFGVVPDKKPGPKTLMGKVIGAEKSRRTRVKRHTMGKKQKKKIKG